MGFVSFLRGFFNNGLNKIDVKKLPSQGLFYKDNFSISIRKVDETSILEYEKNYISDNVSSVIYQIKNIVEKNTVISNGKYSDIRSIDIIYIFLEIVSFTKGRPINITYYDRIRDVEKKIEFSHKHFNYFHISPELMKSYNSKGKYFSIDGYKYTLPTIGVESSITNFLVSMVSGKDGQIYSTYFYDFTYFLGHKNSLSHSEIDNLIQIFNSDMEEIELSKIEKILKIFEPMHKYSLKDGDNIVEINSKVNLEKIWR